MKIKSRKVVGKTSKIFKPLALMSDAALYVAGYREHEKQTQQPIPLKLAVISGFLLAPVYLFVFFLIGTMTEQTQLAEAIYKSSWSFLIPVAWSVIGLSLAPLQVWRVQRVNRALRQRRLEALERKAESETIALPIAISVPPMRTTESPVQYVTQGIS